MRKLECIPHHLVQRVDQPMSAPLRLNDRRIRLLTSEAKREIAPAKLFLPPRGRPLRHLGSPLRTVPHFVQLAARREAITKHLPKGLLTLESPASQAVSSCRAARVTTSEITRSRSAR